MKTKNRLKVFTIAILAVVMMFMFVGCDVDDSKTTGGEKGTILLAPAMNIDVSDGVVTIPREIDGKTDSITWSTSRTAVATVDQEGKVTPISSGNTKITAKIGDKESVCSVTVTKIYHNYTVISTAEEFKAIRSDGDYSSADTFYCLGADIDFEGEELEPIGGWDGTVLTNQFNATLDGRGYALKNFKIVENPSSCISEGNTFGVSLFPRVQDGAVRNLNLIGIDYTSWGFTGGIAGIIEKGTVENCFVQGKINATSGFTSTVPSGGIAGIMGAGATVANCFVDLEILGGYIFAGFNFGSGTNCYAVSEHIGDDGDLKNQTDATTNPDELGALKKFQESGRKEISALSDIDNYDLGKRWSIQEGYMAYITRVDGAAPEWALMP